jgi:hypothetical protein
VYQCNLVNQNFGQNGKRHAYAINQVILALTDNIEIYNRYDWYQQKLYNELSNEDIDAASEIATQLLEELKENGSVPLR